MNVRIGVLLVPLLVPLILLAYLGAMLSPTVFGLWVIGGASSGSSQQSLGVRASGRRPSRRGRSATTCRGGLAGRSRRALSVWAPSWS